MNHDSEVLKEFLKAQLGEEFGVCIPDKESVQVRNYGIMISYIVLVILKPQQEQVGISVKKQVTVQNFLLDLF